MSERMTSPPTMKVEEAAKFLGIGRNQAYDSVRRGELPSIRLGNRILVLRQPLERMLRGEASPKAAA